MKRIGGLYDTIISVKNLESADVTARKGKSRQHGVMDHDKNRESNIQSLSVMLRDKTYKTSAYKIFTIFEPKERQIFRLPYFPDRITHHAVMNVLEDVFTRMFTADTYACIKGRGIHGALRAVKRALRDEAGTQYCLQLDIKKFYPSIDHDILKRLLRRKFKDQSLLWLLDEIIDSATGLPIGNYLSQYFANFYLTGFDHWMKESKKVKYYFRYADDMVIFAADKESLHQLRKDIQEYMQLKLKLEIKRNYRVFPVSCGLDFVGYVCYHTHTLLRPIIKKNFARMLAKRPTMSSIASYYGWIKHCNGNNLIKVLLNEKFQRIQHRHRTKVLRRGQNKNRQSFKP